MKFFLIIQVCSVILNQCEPPRQPNLVFDQYYQCAISGYEFATRLTNNLGAEFVNKYKVVINFSCNEFENI